MEKVTTSDRLKSIMRDRNLKQVDILSLCSPYCDKYGIKLNKNDLSQYVSGKVVPKQDKLSILGMALGVSEVWLMGYDVPPKKNGAPPPPDLSDREAELVRRYRFIDDIGKNRVDVNLNLEYDRCAAERGNASSA